MLQPATLASIEHRPHPQLSALLTSAAETDPPTPQPAEIASDPRTVAPLYSTTAKEQRRHRFRSHLIHGDRPDALHDPRFVEPDDVVQSPTFLPFVDVVVDVG